MVVEAVYLGFVIGNLVLITAFRFQVSAFSVSAFQHFPPASVLCPLSSGFYLLTSTFYFQLFRKPRRQGLRRQRWSCSGAERFSCTFLLQPLLLRRIIARLFVMGGTSAQFSVGQASLSGRHAPPRAAAPPPPPSPGIQPPRRRHPNYVL